MRSRSLSVGFDRGRAMDDKLKHLEFIVRYIAIITVDFAVIFFIDPWAVKYAVLTGQQPSHLH